MIKIVLWDIDGTLTNFKEAESVGIKNCFKKFNLGRCTKPMLKKYSEINAEYWKKLERKEISKPELLVKRFDDFFSLYNIECDTAAFNEQYQEELRECVILNKNAKETIDTLEKLNIPQYVVTNGLNVSQNKKLRKVNLEDKFLKVFISDDIGYDKPTPEFFKPVFEEISKAYPEVNKDEIMIIGDSLTSDIQGGINAGIKTCWYNPEHLKADVKPDFEVDDLNDVLKIAEDKKMPEEKETETKVKKPRTRKKKEAVEEVKTEVAETVKETKPEVKEMVIEPKKNSLKDIVDTNYRVIIICLAAIALLFVCLFVGTSGHKNTYELSEITTTETEGSVTLPKNWYMSDDGYAYEVEDKYATPVMYIAMQSTTRDEIDSAFEQVKASYETEDATYNNHETLIIRNLGQSTGEDPVYDCAYMVINDNEVLCLMFTDVDSSVETEILNSIK